MKQRVIVIHGVTSNGGEETTGKLIPPLKDDGYDVYNYQYDSLDNYLTNKKLSVLSEMLKGISKPTDKIIAYSNGCAIVATAMDKGAEFDKICFIHPALRCTWKIPTKESCKSITVFHSLQDKTTVFAKMLGIFSPLSDIWGAMGTYGAKQKDSKIININDNFNHFGIFKSKNFNHGWKDAIIKSIKD